ncbi:MAG: helix-turn-helix domain-containing protein [Acidimicrobiia bacterium]|nr:helix-turn-helix domain-containing protein [Acidimicrobiia bacterium]MBT8249081.1 helix-turn-helix domain-containing protein [Acidimicrobiia bacterium]NNC43716.1 helix-turn-helix domain-containing protein [Acidimicrobiia bacterium]NND14642.1 helix-turn-helix domain-containing protein [Acidimicrobiia bacterium]NNL27253.1 helix-turn-helix domain-containing protein [Acidimicrobiia bacterium]
MERIALNISKEWLSVADICEYMDVSPYVVTRMIRSGDLPGVKFGREWRISTTDFETYLNDQRSRSIEIAERT